MDRSRRRAHVILLAALCAFLVGTLAWASIAEVELSAAAPDGSFRTVR